MITKSNISKTIGETIVKKRKERGLNQKDCAEQLGMSNTTLGLYERGERTPDAEMLVNISEFFNVPLDDLCGVSTGNGNNGTYKLNTVGDLARIIVDLRKIIKITPVFKSYFDYSSSTSCYVEYTDTAKKGVEWFSDMKNRHYAAYAECNEEPPEVYRMRQNAGFVIEGDIDISYAFSEFVRTLSRIEDFKNQFRDIGGSVGTNDEFVNNSSYVLTENAVKEADKVSLSKTNSDDEVVPLDEDDKDDEDDLPF